LTTSKYAGDHRAKVDPHADVKAGRELARGLNHLKTAPDGIEHGVFDPFEKPAGGHEGVADRLDLLDVVAHSDLFPLLDKPLEVLEDLLGTVPLAILCEAYDVHEHHRDVIVAVRLHRTGRLELDDDLVGKENVQEFVGATLFALQLAIEMNDVLEGG